MVLPIWVFGPLNARPRKRLAPRGSQLLADQHRSALSASIAGRVHELRHGRRVQLHGLCFPPTHLQGDFTPTLSDVPISGTLTLTTTSTFLHQPGRRTTTGTPKRLAISRASPSSNRFGSIRVSLARRAKILPTVEVDSTRKCTADGQRRLSPRIQWSTSSRRCACA